MYPFRGILLIVYFDIIVSEVYVLMKKRLSTIGGSLGLVIDKPILELLKINRETEIEVTTDGRGLYLKPVRPENSVPDEEIDAALKSVTKKYSRALKNLAK